MVMLDSTTFTPRVRRPLPETRPRAGWTVPVALVVAAAAGFVSGFAPGAALLVGLTVVVAALVVRLDWAAAAVVAAAVFEDYLAVVDPRLTKLLALVLVGAWLLRRAQGPLAPRRDPATRSPARSGVLLAALALVVTLLTSAVLHADGTAGLAVLLRWTGFVVVLVVLVDAMRGPLAPRRLARMYVVACTAAAVCGITEYLLERDQRVGGPVEDPNDFAFFLLAALPLALGLRARARHRWAYDVAVLVLAAGLVGTLSRGALVGLAALLVVAVLTRQLSVRAVLFAGVATVTTAALALSLFPHLVAVSLEQKEHVAEQNVAERLELWEAASRMTLDAPVLGHGPGSFAESHRAYLDRTPLPSEETLDVTHNTYLETAAEVGLLGLTALLVLLGAGYLAARSGGRARGDRLAGSVAVALVGTAVAALFVSEQFFLPLWLLCALGAGLAEEEVAEP